MKKTLKKISALVLALAMVVAMSATVFAATTTNGVIETDETTIDITKTILVFNDNGSTVYKPGITYNYTVAPAAPASTTTITDEAGKSVVVQAGPTDGVTLSDSTAVFDATETVDASDAGAEISDKITASVDLTKFTKAGVYRYLITETVPTNLTAVGINRPADYVNTRYLDVYVKNNDGTLAVYGYVCYIGADANVIDAETVANNKITGKTTGFVEQYDTDPTTGTTLVGNVADRYYTYDLTITKTITGDLADMTHQFPFVFTTSGAVAGQHFTYDNGTVGAIGTGNDISKELGNNGTLSIFGLPANTTFNVTETNNTADTYKVSITGVQDGDNSAEVEVAANGTRAVNDANAVKISTYTASNDENFPTANYSAIVFTNKLEAISPTGVVLRFGPYALMLGAGIALLILTIRRKSLKDED